MSKYGIDYLLKREFFFHLKNENLGFITIRYYKFYEAIKFVRKKKKVFLKDQKVRISIDLTDCPKTKTKELKEFRSYDHGAWSVSERETSYSKEVDLFELCPIYIAKACNHTMKFNNLDNEYVFRSSIFKRNKQNILIK